MLTRHKNVILLTAFNIKYFQKGIAGSNFGMSNEMNDIF